MRDYIRRNPAYRARTLQRAKEWRAANPSRRRELDAIPENREKKRKERIEFYWNNRERVRSQRMKATFGITLVEYQAMSERQGGVCAVCGGPPTTKNVLQIDHDHATGKVRDLLCGHCNAALGMARDNTETLAKMISYLERHR